MLRTACCFLFFAGAFLLTGAAEASWAHTHIKKAWTGGLTYQEVEDLTRAAAKADPKTQDGYWTLVLLAAHHDAIGGRELACELVDRFEDVGKYKKDMRLNLLRASCLVIAGDLGSAAELAGKAASVAANTEPLDYYPVLFRAHEIKATSLLQLAKANPDDVARQRQAKRALAAWQLAARMREAHVPLVEALAWQEEYDETYGDDGLDTE